MLRVRHAHDAERQLLQVFQLRQHIGLQLNPARTAELKQGE